MFFLYCLSFIFLVPMTLVGFELPTAPKTSQYFSPGLVVEKAETGYGAARAEMRKGDVLLSWSRGGSLKGYFETPFDLFELELEGTQGGHHD